jgi:arsenate reductase
MTTHVLILCTHNSARSILAEAMLNHLARRCGRDVSAHSAGSSPRGSVNPFAIEALQAAGIDTRGLCSKSWEAFACTDAPPISIVVTVCDDAAGEACPAFRAPSARPPVRVHWSYADPSVAVGGDEAKRTMFELTRQAMGYRMRQLLELPLETMDRDALEAALRAIGHS